MLALVFVPGRTASVPSIHLELLSPDTLELISVHPPHPFSISQWTLNVEPLPVGFTAYTPLQSASHTSLSLLQLAPGVAAAKTLLSHSTVTLSDICAV